MKWNLGLLMIVAMLSTSCITTDCHKPNPKPEPSWGEDHWDEPEIIIL